MFPCSSFHRSPERDIDEERKRAAVREVVRKIQNCHSKKERTNESLIALRDERRKVGKKHRRELYKALGPVLTDASKACDAEIDYIKKMIAELDKLRNKENEAKMEGLVRRHTLMAVLNSEAAGLPLWVNQNAKYPTEGVGGIPYPDDHVFKKGDYVAAYIEENWILAEVEVSNMAGKVGIKDIEDEQHEVISVPRRRLIGLPAYRAHPERDGHALFPPDAIVLALYPQTTCFYKGAVVTSPATASSDYTIAFEDNSYAGGYSPPLPVPQRYVVGFKEVKMRGRKKAADDDQD